MTIVSGSARAASTTRRVAAALLTLAPAAAPAQKPARDLLSTDSVTVSAGAEYRAGGMHRFLLGGTYRDLWLMPIRAPVLNLRTFDGGLKPEKAGGGFETKSLRLIAPDGVEYTFRSVDKTHGPIPAGLADVAMANSIANDQTSSSHPAANVIVAALLEAAGVLHESPVLVVMPDDTLLGKYRKGFAHRLGLLQLYPRKTKGDTPGFADAIDIIDSDTLLHLLDRDPAERVDAPAFLAARLIDMLVNNWDRHPGQWKWARLQPAPMGAWEPISRDYDKAFISVSGFLPGVARHAFANLITFDSTYPSVHALTWNSVSLDRRLLGGLAKPVWDSVARAVAQRITDSVIDAALRAMPVEYRPSAPALTAKLRVRRDSLPAIADRVYRYLTSVVDIHATDAADHATITRVDDRYVEVRLEARDSMPYFLRRFDANETSEIRVYLHGGDDQARVIGDVPSSIPLWIVGGNGTNRLADSSSVGGRHNTTRFYDVGTVSGVTYPPDTLFNRRPMVNRFGHLVPPGKDYGVGTSPIIGLSITHDMGIQPRLGMTWYRYGFRHDPYASMVALEGRYSFKIGGYRLALTADQRRESSPLHFTELARMSQLELVNFHGFGNSSPQSPGLVPNVSAPRTDYYALNQREWLFQPALALALGPTTGLSFGPVLQYSVIDSTPNRFVSATRPYGFGHFGEAGLRFNLYRDDRAPPRHAHRRTVLDLSASYFPALWDVRSAFGVVNATGAVYFTIPVLLHPYLGLRGGAKKVFGDFPFQESAFIGGRTDVRTLDLQRYAGDASLYATAELRIPVAKFTVLLPLNVGLLATEDFGRVYVKGDSPGGWHNAFGTGFWVAFHELSLDIRVMRANEVGRPAVIALRFAIPGVIQ